MKKSVLKKYAELIIKKGINLQKGQEVEINCSLDQPEFTLLLTEEAYKAGAKKVSVNYIDSRLDRFHTKYMKKKDLSKVENWEIEKAKHRAEVLPCIIWIESEDPDVLKNVNMTKYLAGRQGRSKILKPYRDMMEDKHQWCIAAVPSAKWAKKVFPELRESQAIEKLWEYILKCSRADGENPCEDIEKHNANLHSRCDYLNSLGLKELHITSSNGTDLKVGLIPDVMFLGGSEKLENIGVYYNANIPSEEIFISPDKNKADGVVYTSRPFAYNGKVINGFSVEFKNGKAVSIKGTTDEETETLNSMINMDEGASHLGEVAFVPYSSPICESDVIYYSILFDENAACHLALGIGFTNLFKDASKYTLEEIRAKGINDSIIHEDFMIGTKDTKITGTDRNGKEVVIFKNGEWAF